MQLEKKLEILVVEDANGFRIDYSPICGEHEIKILPSIDACAAWYAKRMDGVDIYFHMPLDLQDRFWDTYSKMGNT